MGSTWVFSQLAHINNMNVDSCGLNAFPCWTVLFERFSMSFSHHVVMMHAGLRRWAFGALPGDGAWKVTEMLVASPQRRTLNSGWVMMSGGLGDSQCLENLEKTDCRPDSFPAGWVVVSSMMMTHDGSCIYFDLFRVFYSHSHSWWLHLHYRLLSPTCQFSASPNVF